MRRLALMAILLAVALLPAVARAGLPVDITGRLVITAQVDQVSQGNIITENGVPVGVFLDDTTPHLAYWIARAVGEHRPDWLIVVAVPPGRPHRHYPPPIISAYETYFFGMGFPLADWLPLPHFRAYVVQRTYPGTVGKDPPTVVQFERVLRLVRARHPEIVFTF